MLNTKRRIRLPLNRSWKSLPTWHLIYILLMNVLGDWTTSEIFKKHVYRNPIEFQITCNTRAKSHPVPTCNNPKSSFAISLVAPIFFFPLRHHLSYSAWKAALPPRRRWPAAGVRRGSTRPPQLADGRTPHVRLLVVDNDRLDIVFVGHTPRPTT